MRFDKEFSEKLNDAQAVFNERKIDVTLSILPYDMTFKFHPAI